jgi:hypothetical protein
MDVYYEQQRRRMGHPRRCAGCLGQPYPDPAETALAAAQNEATRPPIATAKYRAAFDVTNRQNAGH